MQQEKTHTVSFAAYPQQMDCTGRLSLPMLVNALIDCAGIAAKANGFSIESLNAHGQTWVLSRLSIAMQHFPQAYECYRVQTWIESCGLLATTRNFRIMAADDTEIGTACSLWSVINVQTRQPVNLSTFAPIHALSTGESVAIAKPIRIAEFAPAETERTHTVVYSDIDINHHVNSTRYIEWMLDNCKMTQFLNHRIITCQLNYHHEAVLGDKVQIRSLQRDMQTFFYVVGAAQKLCSMRLTWAERNER